jgi:UDP:flavonoid glycosyltransferase YjiC (YdhE family)
VGVGLAQTEDYVIRTAAPMVDELRAWAGLEPDPEGRKLAETPYFTLTPPALEAPDGPLPERAVRFHDATARPHPAPDPDAPPLVYVTFGTVAATLGLFPGFYRTVIEALEGLPVRIVMTVGDAADEAELGSLPANVSAKRWIPQADILSKASAMVGHGGFGTTTGALLAGVPQVVVPLFADQPYNAARIAELGAGLVASAEEPATIRTALQRVLAEPSFRGVAARAAREAFALPPIEAVSSSLLELVALAREHRAA